MTTAGSPLPPLAGVDDLATWLGEEIAEDQAARAQTLLRQASARARRRTGRTWVDDTGALAGVPDEVAGIVLEAAARVWLNPEGLSSETDADYTTQRAGSWAEAGTVYFTPGQEATLDAYRATPRTSGLWTQPTTRGDYDEACASYAESDPFGEGWPGTQS